MRHSQQKHSIGHLSSKMKTQILLYSIFQLSFGKRYPDIEQGLEQPKNAKVNIRQSSPQLNAILIGHNNPTGSDINIVQTSPFNTSINVGINGGSKCKVRVTLSNCVNVQLHVNLNSILDSTVTVQVFGARNTAVHVSMQNPVNTPVKVGMSTCLIWLITIILGSNGQC